MANIDTCVALLLAKMATTPQAVWFSEGTPRAVKADVKKTMTAAVLTHTVRGQMLSEGASEGRGRRQKPSARAAFRGWSKPSRRAGVRIDANEQRQRVRVGLSKGALPAPQERLDKLRGKH